MANVVWAQRLRLKTLMQRFVREIAAAIRTDPEFRATVLASDVMSSADFAKALVSELCKK